MSSICLDCAVELLRCGGRIVDDNNRLLDNLPEIESGRCPRCGGSRSFDHAAIEELGFDL